MTVLITGGTGLIGPHTAIEFVKNGKDVVILVHKQEPPEFLSNFKNKITPRRGDIVDLNNLLEVTEEVSPNYIVHLAALTTFKCEKNPIQAANVNCVGMSNVLEVARKHDCDKVVCASSVAVYGDAPSTDEVAEENRPVNPVTVYGASKLFLEKLVLNYYERYELDTIALRFGSVYGLSNIADATTKTVSFSEQARSIVEFPIVNIPVKIPRGGKQPCDFVYVKDVAEGIINACSKRGRKLDHRIFNIGLGETNTLKGFAKIVKEDIPDADIKIGSQPESAYPFLGPLSIERAQKELDYEPRPFQKGVREYLREAKNFYVDSLEINQDYYQTERDQ